MCALQFRKDCGGQQGDEVDNDPASIRIVRDFLKNYFKVKLDNVSSSVPKSAASSYVDETHILTNYSSVILKISSLFRN